MLNNSLDKIKRLFKYSRTNREELQKDLYYYLLNDKPVNDELYKVIHCGAYYVLYDVDQYRTNKYIPYAKKYSDLVKKYVPNIDLEYPDNIDYIYEQFKKDILGINRE